MPLNDAILLPENGAASALSDFKDLRTALDGAKTSLQIKLTDLENSRVVLEQARPAAGPRVSCLARALIGHGRLVHAIAKGRDRPFPLSKHLPGHTRAVSSASS